MPRPTRDRFAGCLVGQCLGDALGFPVEGYPPGVCSRYVEEELRKGRAGERSRPPFAFGQYTDDSQLARALLESYAETGSFRPEAYARRVADAFSEGSIVGPGRATSEAAARLARGVPWERSGTPPPAAGNGSAMRAGPVGLLFHDDPEGLVRAAEDQGRITHRDPRCSAGAVAVAGAVALALRPGPVHPTAFLHQLAEWTDRIEPSFGGYLRRLAGWVRLPPAEAVERIAPAGISAGYRDGWEGISPFVVGSVLWSLYAFLRSPDRYWDTVCTAIAVGGDVDTTAAMAGAISGAHLGLSALPSDLAQHLHDRGGWRLDDLVALTDRCFVLRTGGPQW